MSSAKVEIYDELAPNNRRLVLRKDPTVTCHCGAVLRRHWKPEDKCWLMGCGRCNAEFYLIQHVGPYMENPVFKEPKGEFDDFPF